MQVSKNIDVNLAYGTLRQALSKTKPNESIILYSDQGSQYCLKKLPAKGISTEHVVAKISTDNAIIESFKK